MINVEPRRNCYFCPQELVPAQESYTLEEIIDWWKESSVVFSGAVLASYPLQTRVTLNTCGNCGFGVFLPNIVGTDGFYAELSRQAASWYYLPDKWEYDRAIEDVAGARSVLDVGCGEGLFLRKLSAINIAAKGLELNATSAAKARRLGLIVNECDLQSVALSGKERFDVVTMFQVLEHLAEPLDTLMAAKECLAPGGRLIISVPNADGMFRWVGPLVTNVPPHHVTRWSTATFEAAAARLGMSVIKSEHEPFWHYGLLINALDHRLRRALGLKGRSGRPGSRLTTLVRYGLRVPMAILARAASKGLSFVRGHSVYVVLEKNGTRESNGSPFRIPESNQTRCGLASATEQSARNGSP